MASLSDLHVSQYGTHSRHREADGLFLYRVRRQVSQKLFNLCDSLSTIYTEASCLLDVHGIGMLLGVS